MRTLRLAREAGGWSLVKLEVLSNTPHLYPDMEETLRALKLLVAEGEPANRLAATGFGDNQPLDAADTAEAYAKNRRIEIRLTDR